MKKKIISMILLTTMALSLIACGAKEEEIIEEVVEPVNVEVTEAEEEEVINEETFFQDSNSEGQLRSYLTGEWVDAETRNSRPLATMVENTEACLPQYGVSNAAIIYECPVEGAITRMMAIFDDYSGMERIGNTRSSRPYFVYFAAEYDAIYSHAGGNPAAFELIDKGVVDNINALDGDVGKYYYRASDKEAPHNLYTSSDGLKKAVALREYETAYPEDYKPNFHFSGTGNNLENGEDCEAFQLYYTYNQPYWIYNAEDGLYYRYEFGKKQMDAAVNKQLTAKNIIIQAAVWFPYTGSDYIGFDLLNTGYYGKLITNGKMIDIVWQKASDSDATEYFYAETGEPIKLNIGQTWVELCQFDYYDKNSYYAKASDSDLKK